MGLCAWKVLCGRAKGCAAGGGDAGQLGGLEYSGTSCPNWIDMSWLMSTRLDLRRSRLTVIFIPCSQERHLLPEVDPQVVAHVHRVGPAPPRPVFQAYPMVKP